MFIILVSYYFYFIQLDVIYCNVVYFNAGYCNVMKCTVSQFKSMYCNVAYIIFLFKVMKLIHDL